MEGESLAEAPNGLPPLPVSKDQARHIVACADLKVSAVYDFESEKAGLPGFWIGKVTAYFGGTTLKAEARARGYNRAMAMALTDLGIGALKTFPPGSP